MRIPSRGVYTANLVSTNRGEAHTVTTPSGVTRYTRRTGRGRHAPCDRFAVPFRPPAGGRMALPHHALGRDVAAGAGNRRSTAHRTAPEIHAGRTAGGVARSVRAGTDLLHRFGA